MKLRERMIELTVIDQVDTFLNENPSCAFFKAGACHKTMQGFGVVEEALNPYPSIPLAYVRVIESRPVSNHIAEVTQVIHQSPQLILVKEGKVVYDVDNWDIIPEAVNAALTEHFGAAASTEASGYNADVTVYKELLQKFLLGDMTESEFERTWLLTFQQDATPRSTAQFNLLNSLYGDVDEALSSPSPLGLATTSSLGVRAKQLLDSL